MNDLMPYFSSDLTPYLLIPVLTAGIGWFTNWLGIKMMLYPTKWIGIGKYIGWQGIMPRVRVRMTRTMVESSVSIICTPQDMLDAIDEGQAVESIAKLISPQIDDWTDAFLKDQISDYWRVAPSFVKNAVYEEVHRQIPSYSRAISDALRGRMSHLIDIAEIAAIESERRPDIFPSLMKKIANKEFKFVIWSGLFIGFPLGCIQSLVWFLYPNSFILPAFGALVGAFTNWLALQCLVYPSTPVNVLGLKIQGLFIARQEKVSKDFAASFTRDFMDPDTIFDYAWNGENKDEVRELVRRQVSKVLNEKVMSGPLYKVLVLAGQGKKVDQNVLSMVEDKIGPILKRPQITKKLAKPIRKLLAKRLAKLTPQQFQGLLMPVFEEDQWILIAVGGVLGFCAGCAQLIYIFGGTLLGA